MACFPTSKASCRFPITAVISPMACWLQVRRAGWFWGAKLVVNHTTKNVRQIVLPSDHHFLWNETRKKWGSLTGEMAWTTCTGLKLLHFKTLNKNPQLCVEKSYPTLNPSSPNRKNILTNKKNKKIHQDLVEIADGDIAQLRILSDDFL